MQTHHVNVTLNENHVVTFAFPGEIEPEQKTAFREDGGVFRVEIFRFPVPDDSPGKTGHISPYIDHGEDETVAEGGVKAPSAAGADQVRFRHFTVGKAFFTERCEKGIEAVRRVAETERGGGFAGNPAGAYVFPSTGSAGGIQLLIKIPRSCLVDFVETGAMTGLSVILLLRNRNTGTFG